MYHYTSEEGLQGILKEKIVLKSDDRREATNYHYGPGVYLTELSPDNDKFKIQRNNYDKVTRSSIVHKTDCYFKFNKEDLCYAWKVELKKRNVWCNPDDIDLKRISFYCGYTEGRENQETLCVPSLPVLSISSLSISNRQSYGSRERQSSHTFRILESVVSPQ